MVIIFALALALWALPFGFADEHGGTAMPQEHGGTTMKEHGGTTTQEHGGTQEVKTPSADDIHAAMKSYIDEKSQATGTFDVEDSETGKTRSLTLERIHDRVGKTGDYFYSCADFKDTVSGDLLDLDLDVQDKDGQLSVVDVRIHKVNGKERYTYDENDNRIPVPAE
jgi:hypothetical protein